MKRLAMFLVIAGLISCIAAGQTASKETRNLKGFNKVSFGISGDLEIKIGPEFSVVLEGNRNDIENIITNISDDKLIIRQESWRFNLKDKVNVFITMPQLEGLGVSGSGKAEILDPVTDADELNLSVSGSGKLVTSELVVDQLQCNISGSGDILIGSGNSDRADISISGSGGYNGENFEIDHLSISVSGSGSCYCKVGDSLEARISGSGNVTYTGNPSIDARVSGSGHVRSAQ